MFNCFREEPKV